MATVPTRPLGANVTVPSLPPLDFADPEAIRTWLARVETVADDGIAAGEDQLLPLDQRRLGRVIARGTVADARAALEKLIDAARRGLPSARFDAGGDAG